MSSSASNKEDIDIVNTLYTSSIFYTYSLLKLFVNLHITLLIICLWFIINNLNIYIYIYIKLTKIF